MFSTYNYPEKSTVPIPPVPSGLLGTVNPTFGTLASPYPAQGEYINSEMDAKQNVAQFVPQVENIACKVAKDTADNKDKKFFPKGTLVMFCEPEAGKSGLYNGSVNFPKSRLSDPTPTSEIYMNGSVCNKEIKIVFPLAEAMELRMGRSQYVAVAVQDACEIYIPAENPQFEFKPGDKVFATRHSNGFHISDTRGDFLLGTSMLHHCNNITGPRSRQIQSIQLALCVKKT